MAIHQPIFLQPAGGDAALIYTAQEWRQMVRAGLTVSDGPGGTQGVTSASSFQVTQKGAGANFSVDVASGLAYVVGDDVTGQGTYVVWNDATVNVATPSPPGSGTDVYRLVLQIQDKLNNGAWTGYTAALMLLPSTSGGGSTPPAEPNSAITLAFISIATGQASVLNANITDYRQKPGTVAAVKAADTARTHATALADDPDLQLLNLGASATYDLDAQLFFTGFNDVSNNQGSLTWKWRLSSGTAITYSSVHVNAAGGNSINLAFAAADTPTAQTMGTATLLGAPLSGTITTGAAPAYAVLQWAQNNDSGTATTMKALSRLRARRIG